MAGTVYSGSHVGIVLSDPTTQRPATVTGSISNKNGDAIYGKPVARWTVVNEGTIQSTGTAGYGIDLAARGTVENGGSGAVSALISGYGGILIRGALATVSNLGTIEGTGAKRDGVELKAGGLVTNGNAGATAARISGGRHAVLLIGAGNVSNFGTLANSGTSGVVDLFAGGAVTNGSSTSTKALISGAGRGVYAFGEIGKVTNFGRIEGRTGVVLSDGGKVTNGGSAAATGALISGANKGLYISGATGTVTNFGTITGGWGAALHTGGAVVNELGASITATTGNGVLIGEALGAVTNLGTITGGKKQAGVRLAGGGKVINGNATTTSALISGRVYITGGAATVTNFGTIDGGVAAEGTPGRIINGSATSTTALISGNVEAGTVTNFGTIGDAVIIGGTVTNLGTMNLTGSGVVGNIVTNFGIINGSDGIAVQVDGIGAKLVVERGAIFVGHEFGIGKSTIDFQISGTADMSKVSGFTTIALGNGKGHTLTLTSANFAFVKAITVEDGNSGNTVTAATLPAADAIIVHAGVGSTH